MIFLAFLQFADCHCLLLCIPALPPGSPFHPVLNLVLRAAGTAYFDLCFHGQFLLSGLYFGNGSFFRKDFKCSDNRSGIVRIGRPDLCFGCPYFNIGGVLDFVRGSRQTGYLDGRLYGFSCVGGGRSYR